MREIFFNGLRVKATSKRLSLIALLFLCLILAVAAGDRVLGIDSDYYSYLSYYNSLSSHGSDRIEPGFRLLAIFAQYFIDLDFRGFLTLVAVLGLIPKFYLFSRSRYPFLLVLMYVPLLYPLHEMTQLRAAIALGFFYLSCFYRHGGSVISAFFLFAIAVSFHYSILVFTPFLFLTKALKQRSTLLSLMILVLPALLFGIGLSVAEYVNPLTAAYMDTDSGEYTEPNVLSLRLLSLMFICFLGYLNIEKMSGSGRVWFYISLYGIGLYYGLLYAPVFAHRVLEMTLMSYFFWLTELPKKIRWFVISVFLVLVFAQFYRYVFIDVIFSS